MGASSDVDSGLVGAGALVVVGFDRPVLEQSRRPLPRNMPHGPLESVSAYTIEAHPNWTDAAPTHKPKWVELGPNSAELRGTWPTPRQLSAESSKFTCPMSGGIFCK